MRKVSYVMNVSLDGFIEGLDGDLGWSTPDEELHKHFNDLEAANDTVLYGRKLYEIMATYWPTADEDQSVPEYVREYARIWKSKLKLVFSRTLDEVGPNSRLVRGDIAEEVQKLKAQPGGDLSVGGAEIAGTFLQLGLIDEVSLYIHPVILGGGKRMFRPLQEWIHLQLMETHTFGSGIVLLKYELVNERR